MSDHIDFEAEVIRLGLPMTMKSRTATKFMDCGPTKLRELVHQGEIAGVKRGKDLMIRTASMLAYNANLPPAQFTLPPKKSKNVNAAA